jgi:hypothetical protein
MLMRHVAKVDLDLSSEPLVPITYRGDVTPLAKRSLGSITFEPRKLRIGRIRRRPHVPVEEGISGDCMLASAIGTRPIDAHAHAYYVANPDLVPKECRGYIVHSPGTLFVGYKGTIHVLGFYFVNGVIREDLFLVSGEITDVQWEDYQVIGIHGAMELFQKPW